MSTLTINIPEHLAETMDFDAIDHGAYLLLLCHYRMTERPLLDNQQELARITRLNIADWMKIRPRLIRLFTVDQDGYWHHAATDAAIEKAEKSRSHAAKASKAAKEKRDAPAPHVNPNAMQKPPSPTVVLPPPEIPPPADDDDEIGTPLDPNMTLELSEYKACLADLPGVSADEIAQVFDSFKRYHLAAGSFSTDWLASWWKWWERKKPARPKAKPRIEVSRKAAEPQPETNDEA